MNVEVIDKATGAVTTTSGTAVDLGAPSIVRLRLDRAALQSLEQDGRDLVVQLANGETVRIADFFVEGATASDLVLVEADDSQWRASVDAAGPRFARIDGIEELMLADAAGGGGGSGFLLPVLGGLGALGGLAAVAAGGGGGGGAGGTGDGGTPADTQAPAAPTLVFGSDGRTVSGRGEAGATVQVTGPNGQSLGTAVVDSTGAYTVTLTSPQANGEQVSATQRDPSGNVSPAVTAQAPDLTAPGAPTTVAVNADGSAVTGRGEPGATVTVTGGGGTVLGRGTVDAAGNFSVTIAPPQQNGEPLVVRQADGAGNASTPVAIVAPDITAPAAPVAEIAPTGAVVTGRGEPGATIEVRTPAGILVASGNANAAGDFAVTLTPPVANGEQLAVSQRDAAGNPSPATPLTAPDVTAPGAPTAAVSADGALVSGSGEAGATVRVTGSTGVLLGSVVVAADGSYAVPLSPPQIDGEMLEVRQADPAGNVSPPTGATAPDLTPDAGLAPPTAAIAPDGAVVAGVGVAGATIVVRDADGVVIAAGQADGGGGYSVALIPPLLDGEIVRVTQAVGAQTSLPATATAPDLTAPAAPDATLDATGALVTGTGEPGATVRVTTAGGTLLGTAFVNARGDYAVALDTPQTNGETLRVTQTDIAGNMSLPTTLTAADTTPPSTLTASVGPDGAVVTGTAEPNASVSVSGPGGLLLGTATAGADGLFSVPIAPPQRNGETVQVIQVDCAGNAAPPVTAIAPDLTAPPAPVAAISGDGTIVSGSGEADARITVTGPGGQIVGTGAADADGNFTVTLVPPQRNGEALTVVQADAANNVSTPAAVTAPDLTAPVAPTLTIAPDGGTASGTGEPGARVVIRNGASEIGTAVVDVDGTYAATLTPPQRNGETLTATQTDGSSNVSPPATATAPDLTAPAAPGLTVSLDGLIATGTGEPGARAIVSATSGATLGIATIDADGRFSVTLVPPQRNGETVVATQIDAGGNVSLPATATAPDLTAPSAPIVDLNDGLTIVGRGEVGATVRVLAADGTEVSRAVVDVDGVFTAPLSPPLLNGERLTVTQTDAATNISLATPTTAPDITPPGPVSAAINGTGTLVTGTGEAGATVSVRAGGVLVGQGTVAADGAFAVALTPAQANGQALLVTQVDAGNNGSLPTPLQAPDITPPAAPSVAINLAGTVVSGLGEPGATVRVTEPDGTELGRGIVLGNGQYFVLLNPPQANGETLLVAQTDRAGNVSPAVPLNAFDITPPAPPTLVISVNGGVATGAGEAGARVTIFDGGGVTVADGVVGPGGTYALPLLPPQTDGQLLTAVLRDRAGNPSLPTSAEAPDTTPPLVPTVTISADGAIVSGQGIPGARIDIFSATGVPIGTAIVELDGSFATPLVPPQRNGEILSVTQTDGGGNSSPPIPLLAPDITAPDAPDAAIDGAGTLLFGTGEPGARVVVTGAGGVVIGTGVVEADGDFAIRLAPPQRNGEALGVTQSDAAGNLSLPTPVLAPDITAPGAPTGLVVAPDGASVSGSGEAGASVRVIDGAGTVIGQGTVGAGGTFNVPVAPVQVAGQTLSVDLTDAAGNRSPITLTLAPFDIDAFDQADSAGLDLVPATVDVDFGSATYVALLSLGLVDLDASVLGVPAVGFTVAPGHSLDAVFSYDAGVSAGVLSNYSVVVQKLVDGRWTAVEGSGPASLLEVGVLNGALVATDTLGAGTYRAFVTFQGAAGLGLLGSLNVGGTDSDFTTIAAINAEPATGNLVTGAGAEGADNIVSPQTGLAQVEVGGVVTPVTANGSVVQGLWGTLTVNLDGSYAYTPRADASLIGRTDSFTYTLIDRSDGELESATLTITIGSPDVSAPPLLSDDTAIATVTYRNVVEATGAVQTTGFSTPGALLLAPGVGSGGGTFTVGAASTSDVTVTVLRDSGLAVLPTYTITVRDASTNAVVRSVTQTALAGLTLGVGLVGAGLALSLDDLPAGTYRYEVSSTNLLGTGYGSRVFVDQSTTFLDRFEVAGTGSADGNLFANDATNSPFATLLVGAAGGTLAEIGAGPGATIVGTYGTLTIDASGDYVYRPNPYIPFSDTDLTDSFTYQVVQPNGVVATATLDIVIDVPGDGVAVLSAAVVEGVPLDGIEMLVLAAPAGEPGIGDDGFVLIDSAGSDDAAFAPLATDGEPGVAGSAIHADPVAMDLTAALPVEAPLAYLVTASDLERHDQTAQFLI